MHLLQIGKVPSGKKGLLTFIKESGVVLLWHLVHSFIKAILSPPYLKSKIKRENLKFSLI